ncbi:hypothetical protein D3C86_1759010 [compost metagenome]
MDFAKVYTCGLGARIFFGDVSVVVAHADHEFSIEYEFDFLNFCMRQIRHSDSDGFLSLSIPYAKTELNCMTHYFECFIYPFGVEKLLDFVWILVIKSLIFRLFGTVP